MTAADGVVHYMVMLLCGGASMEMDFELHK
jgi:hypothetical protein